MGSKLSEWRLKLTDMVSSKMERITALADKAAGNYAKLQSQMDKLSGGLKSAADQVPGLNQALAVVSNPYVLATAGTVALGAGLVDATGRALDFERGMAAINTTAQLNQTQLAALRDELLTMGGQSTVPIREIPAAFGQVISAVGDTQRSLEIFGPALKASQAGFTDIKTVVDALTNTLGAVGDASPTDVLNTLFATVRVGKGEFADFAGYLPKIIPLANNAGIKYQEVAGAFALMTAKGQGAAEASTLLSNAMTALSKSEVIYGSKSHAGFERSGIAIFNQAGQMRKLTDIVDDLSKKTTGMTDKQKQGFLAGLGLDAQASAAFSVLAQYSKELRADVGATTNSAGELAKAFELSLNPADRFTLLMNRVGEGMTRVGYQLLPLVNRGLDLLSAGITFVSENMTTLKGVAEGALGGISVLLGGLAVQAVWTGVAWVASMVSSVGATFLFEYALLAVRTAIFSIPIIGWAAAGIAALITLYQTSDLFRAGLAGIGAVLLSLWDPIKLLGAAIANLFNPAAFAANLSAFVESVRNLDVRTTYDSAYLVSMNDSAREQAAAKSNKSALDGLKQPGGPPKPPKPTALNDGIKSVNDGGRQVRNVTVHIGQLVKELNINSTTGSFKESAEQLRDYIMEEIIRAVGGAETALG